MQCRGIESIYDQLTRGSSYPSYIIYLQCSSTQGIYALFTGGSICSSWCSSIQGIYAELTGEDIYIYRCILDTYIYAYIYIYIHIYIYICSVVVLNASMLD